MLKGRSTEKTCIILIERKCILEKEGNTRNLIVLYRGNDSARHCTNKTSNTPTEKDKFNKNQNLKRLSILQITKSL